MRRTSFLALRLQHDKDAASAITQVYGLCLPGQIDHEEKTKHNNNQATTNDQLGSPWTLLSTNLRYVYQSLAPVDNSVLETLAETE